MFPPSLDQILSSASIANQFIVELPGGIRVSASNREDQQLAHETIRFVMELQTTTGSLPSPNRTSSIPAQSNTVRAIPQNVESVVVDALDSKQAVSRPITNAVPTSDTKEVEDHYNPVTDQQVDRPPFQGGPPSPQTSQDSSDEGSPLYGATAQIPSALPPAPKTNPHVSPYTNAAGEAPLGVFQPITARTFGLATTAYLEEIRDREYSLNTQHEIAFVFRLFRDLVGGDRLLHTLDGVDMENFIRSLKLWPVNASKKQDFQCLTPKKIVEKARRENWKPICTRTCQKHVDHLRAFFRWCMQRNYIYLDLLRGARQSAVTESHGVTKVAFSDHDLSLIFDHDKMLTYKCPHKFWAPLIGIYMGPRVNEICQLHLDDVLITDTPTFRLSNEFEGQHVKNKSSHRLVPIHPELIELGFLNYLKDLHACGAKHLFPGLRWGKNGPGEVISSWFNRTHLRGFCKFDTKEKTFHSLRHTFATRAAEKNVKIHLVSQILGHSPEDNVTLRVYVMPSSVPILLKEIKKVKYPVLNVPSYRSENFKDYLMHVTAPGYSSRRRNKKKEASLTDDSFSPLL